MPDPHLQAVAAEIQAILKREDIGGGVMLASKTHTEYFFELSPSWSCIKFNPETRECRIKALLKDFPSKEARNECITHSCGLLLGLMHVANRIADNMKQMMGVIAKHVPEIRHIDRDETDPKLRYKFPDEPNPRHSFELFMTGIIAGAVMNRAEELGFKVSLHTEKDGFRPSFTITDSRGETVTVSIKYEGAERAKRGWRIVYPGRSRTQ